MDFGIFSLYFIVVICQKFCCTLIKVGTMYYELQPLMITLLNPIYVHFVSKDNLFVLRSLLKD